MTSMLKLSLLASLVVIAACSHRPKHEEEASKHYSQGINVYSLSESDQWKTKACPKSSDPKWKESDWKSLVQMANGCVVQSNWSMVEEVGNHLARQDHLAPWGSYYLSLSAEARKDHSRALWMIDLAQKKAPKVGLLKYQKGRILWSLEEYTQAMEHFEEALDQDPGLLDAHLMLGQIFYRDQEFGKARTHFEAVLKKDSSNYVSTVGMAECELKAGNVEKALSLFNRAIRRNSNDLALRLRQVYIYETVAVNLPEALESLKEIRDLVKRGKLSGQVGFDINSKIKDLESSLSQLALNKDETSRKPAQEEKVSK